jgi:methionyl-tRNA formyltransferase
MNKRTLFLGSKKLGLEILNRIYEIAPNSLSAVAALDDSKDERGCLDLFRQFCEKTGTPLKVITKNSDLEAVIDQFKPDLCMVNGYYKILKPEVLKRFPAGCMGIHGSLLPHYRGGSPLVWSILNGDRESGISLFYFDEGMDTGNIIGQKRFDIGEDETIADILAKVERLSIELISDFYPQILAGTAPGTIQDHNQATYTAMRQPSDGQIDWKWNAGRVYDFIRAQTTPYPGAFTYLPGGEKMIIWKARRFDFPFYGPPGKVVQILADGIVVACGDASAIIIERIQKEGQEIMNAENLSLFNSKFQ